MNTVVRTPYTFVLAGVVLALSGCSANPFDSDTASSSVQFALAGARTSAGAFLCSEADLAQLRVSPSGADSQTESLSVGGDCRVNFSVTVPKGDVSFTGELSGRGRPLMRGARRNFKATEDGFVVVIDLSEIEALDIRTETFGLGGPALYTFEVDGNETRIPIGKDATDTVAALAGGARFVTLDTQWCAVVNGPARREVMIPTDETQLGATLFQIDCNQGGDVDVVVITSGPAVSPGFMVDIGDKTMNNIGRNDSITVSGVTPGPIDVVLDTKDANCTANDVTDPAPPHFLRSAGSLRVEFLVFCIPTGPRSPVVNDSIRVVTSPVRPPGPGEVQTFDVTVTDADGFAQTASLASVSDSVTFFTLPPAVNPQTVTLTATGSCGVVNGPATRVANIPASGFLRVVFDVGC